MAGIGNNSQRVCVLGGSGFVGQRLAARLADSDWLLRVVTRSSLRPQHLRVLSNVDVVTADIFQADTLAALFNDCSAVVNLVGILNEAGFDGSGFRRAHVELTRLALQACRDAGVSRFVQVSALGADAVGAPSHYLRSKGEAEALIEASSDFLDWTILQPSVIFGPGDDFLNRFARLLRLLPGPFPLARPAALFAPVHVDDVAAAIQCSLEDTAPIGQRLEIYGPEVYTLRELVQMIARACGLKRRVIGLPDGLARLQARVLERLPGKLFTMDNYLSLTVPSVGTVDGLARLGIQPRSLEVNLAETLGMPRNQLELNSFRRLAGR
jgi:NADH dehydrogenase